MQELRVQPVHHSLRCSSITHRSEIQFAGSADRAVNNRVDEIHARQAGIGVEDGEFRPVQRGLRNQTVGREEIEHASGLKMLCDMLSRWRW